MHSLCCTKCKYNVSIDEFGGIEIPPKCPRCGALVRPDVVLFGELIDGRGVEHLQTELEKGFDVIFSIGTTSVFPYIQAPILHGQVGGQCHSGNQSKRDDSFARSGLSIGHTGGRGAR